MLCTCSDIVWTYMIRVLTLHTFYLSDSHLRIHICILAEAFPHTRPLRIASEVHCRRESPRNVCSTAFVCRNLTHIIGMLAVESSGNVHLLREKDTTGNIRNSVDMVKSVKTRYTHGLH